MTGSSWQAIALSAANRSCSLIPDKGPLSFSDTYTQNQLRHRSSGKKDAAAHAQLLIAMQDISTDITTWHEVASLCQQRMKAQACMAHLFSNTPGHTW